MATIKICDECKEPKPTPFTVTEHSDGAVYDLCSAACLIAHYKTMEAAK
jgi:hypothetical protein